LYEKNSVFQAPSFEVKKLQRWILLLCELKHIFTCSSFDNMVLFKHIFLVEKKLDFEKHFRIKSGNIKT